jgi:hypothetical protein
VSGGGEPEEAGRGAATAWSGRKGWPRVPRRTAALVRRRARGALWTVAAGERRRGFLGAEPRFGGLMIERSHLAEDAHRWARWA